MRSFPWALVQATSASLRFAQHKLLTQIEKGKSNGTAFSRNFEKLEGEILRIDFVNHIKTYNAKDQESEGVVVSRRKPRVIIIDEFGAL